MKRRGIVGASSSDGANRDTRQRKIVGSRVAGDFRPISVANGGLTELILVASKEDFVMGKISFLPSTSPPAGDRWTSVSIDRHINEDEQTFNRD